MLLGIFSLPHQALQANITAKYRDKCYLSTACYSIQEKGDGGKAASLSIANVGGIFVVLLGGLALACVTACIEYLWTDSKENRSKKVRNYFCFIASHFISISPLGPQYSMFNELLTEKKIFINFY